MNNKIKRCKKCILPNTYPGIDFNEKGICNYCNYFEASKEMRNSLKEDLKGQFYQLIEETKTKKKEYDCIVCYSGGKDSTFLLMELKEKFNLKILAFTLDNNFLSDRAKLNIKVIVNKLCIDYIIIKPEQDIICKIFRDVLTQKIVYPTELTAMLSPLCVACQGMILAAAFRLAKEKDISIVFVGFTPGQYPDVSYENFLKTKSCIYFSNTVYKDDPPDIIKMIRDPIDEVLGEKAGKYYLKSQYLEKGESYPYALFPFHAILNYNEEYIYKKIKTIGWIKPDDTDSCSTNCLINSLANLVFLKQYGYHPYIAEISAMVRDGLFNKEYALGLEKIEENNNILKRSLDKLQLSREDVGI